jgi:non-specific serine/threonine protein kinase
MGAVCALPDIGEDNDREKPALPPPADENLRELAASAPPMRGAEYLTPAVLAELWRVTDAAFDTERAEAKLSVQAFLKSRHPAWNLVGRVHFNLAENRKNEEAPFAFLATYTTDVQARGGHPLWGRRPPRQGAPTSVRPARCE